MLFWGLAVNTAQLVSRGKLQWLSLPALQRVPWLVHGFSTRRGGVSRGLVTGLNLGFGREDSRETVEQNRQAFLKALDAQDFQLATLKQVHSALPYAVLRTPQGTLAYRPGGFPLPAGHQPAGHFGDALLTNQPDILLSVRTADCLPLLVADAQRRVIAAIHAGWRGMLARIVEKTLGEMRRIYGSEPKDLRVAMGPSIRACCYPVGEEVLEAFRSQFAGGDRFFRWAASGDPSAKLRELYPLLFLTQYPPGHGPEFSRTPHLDRLRPRAINWPPLALHRARFLSRSTVRLATPGISIPIARKVRAPDE